MLVSDPELIRRMETTAALRGRTFGKSLAHLPLDRNIDGMEIGGGYALFAGADSFLTGAWGMGADQPVRPADLDALESFFQKHHADTRVELSPIVATGLMDDLCERDYHVSYLENLLVRPIRSNESFPEPASPIQVEPVSDHRVAEWGNVIGRAFGDGANRSTQHDEIAAMFHAMPESTCLAALWDGKLAGGGVVTNHEGVAWLAFTSVRREYRGRGIHTALLNARLRIAGDAGCDFVCMKAVPGNPSQRNAERCAFRVVYTKLSFLRRHTPSRT